MSTYKDIEVFLIEVFPQEYEKIMLQKKSGIEQFVEKADEDFEKNLKAIIAGKDTETKS
jgi:hypothetical protein